MDENQADVLTGRGEHERQFLLARTRCVKTADIFCLSKCETGYSAAFVAHVLHIVALASKKQMRRVAAWRVVAAVKDVHPLRDRSVGKSPRESVGIPGLPVHEHLAVGASWDSARPYPVVVSLLHPRPKVGRRIVRLAWHSRSFRGGRGAGLFAQSPRPLCGGILPSQAVAHA